MGRLKLLFLIPFLFLLPHASAQACPSGPHACIWGVTPTGTWKHINLDANGNVNIAGSGALSYQTPTTPCPNPEACPYALGTDGKFHYFQVDANGNLQTTGGGGAGNPGGSATQLQFNNAGTSFGGVSSWTSNGTTTITGDSSGILDLSALTATDIKFPYGVFPWYATSANGVATGSHSAATLNSLITTCAGTGGVILFDVPGTYTFTSQITANGNNCSMGTLLPTGSVKIVKATGFASDGVLLVTGNHLTLSGLTIDGNGQNFNQAGSNDCTIIQNATDILVENMVFQNCGNTGSGRMRNLWINGGTNIRVINSQILGPNGSGSTTGDGMFISGSSSADASQILIQGNYFDLTGVSTNANNIGEKNLQVHSTNAGFGVNHLKVIGNEFVSSQNTNASDPAWVAEFGTYGGNPPQDVIFSANSILIQGTQVRGISLGQSDYTAQGNTVHWASGLGSITGITWEVPETFNVNFVGNKVYGFGYSNLKTVFSVNTSSHGTYTNNTCEGALSPTTAGASCFNITTSGAVFSMSSSGCTESGNTVSCTTNSSYNTAYVYPGIWLWINGVTGTGCTGYNGYYQVATSDGTTGFTYTNPTSGLANVGCTFGTASPTASFNTFLNNSTDLGPVSTSAGGLGTSAYSITPSISGTSASNNKIFGNFAVGSGSGTTQQAVLISPSAGTTADANTIDGNDLINWPLGIKVANSTATNTRIGVSNTYSGTTTPLTDSGTTTVKGLQIAGAAATSGHYPRGDGASYVDGTIQAGDLPAIPLSGLATQAADTVVQNATGGVAAPTAVAMPTGGTNGCAGASNALTYNTTSHAWGCNTISGSGTVNSGTANHLAYYASSTTAVSNDATATDDGTTFTYSGTGGITASAGPLVSGLPAGGVGSSFFLKQEGTIPSGLSTSGQDDCYADSTQHGILCNFNAGSTLPLVQAPASTTANHFALFNAANGGLLKDLGTDFVFNGTHSITVATTGILDLSGATGTAAFKVPSTTTNTATAAGVIDYDSTNSNYHAYSGADSLIGIVPTANVPTTGHVIDALVASSKFLLHDSGIVTANVVNASSPGAGYAHFAGSTQTVTSVTIPRAITFTFGAPEGSALSTGITRYVTVPFACTISAYNLLADAGTFTVKFWKIATGTAIPTVSNSINTSGVSLSSGTAVHSTTVTDFTSTTVSANDIMAANITAVATAKMVQAALQCDESQ